MRVLLYPLIKLKNQSRSQLQAMWSTHMKSRRGRQHMRIRRSAKTPRRKQETIWTSRNQTLGLSRTGINSSPSKITFWCNKTTTSSSNNNTRWPTSTRGPTMTWRTGPLWTTFIVDESTIGIHRWSFQHHHHSWYSRIHHRIHHNHHRRLECLHQGVPLTFPCFFFILCCCVALRALHEISVGGNFHILIAFLVLLIFMSIF